MEEELGSMGPDFKVDGGGKQWTGGGRGEARVGEVFFFKIFLFFLFWFGMLC